LINISLYPRNHQDKDLVTVEDYYKLISTLSNVAISSEPRVTLTAPNYLIFCILYHLSYLLG